MTSDLSISKILKSKPFSTPSTNTKYYPLTEHNIQNSNLFKAIETKTQKRVPPTLKNAMSAANLDITFLKRTKDNQFSLVEMNPQLQNTINKELDELNKHILNDIREIKEKKTPFTYDNFELLLQKAGFKEKTNHRTGTSHRKFWYQEPGSTLGQLFIVSKNSFKKSKSFYLLNQLQENLELRSGLRSNLKTDSSTILLNSRQKIFKKNTANNSNQQSLSLNTVVCDNSTTETISTSQTYQNIENPHQEAIINNNTDNYVTNLTEQECEKYQHVMFMEYDDNESKKVSKSDREKAWIDLLSTSPSNPLFIFEYSQHFSLGDLIKESFSIRFHLKFNCDYYNHMAEQMCCNGISQTEHYTDELEKSINKKESNEALLDSFKENLPSYRTAFNIFSITHQLDNKDSNFYLAYMYSYGYGTKKNYSLALEHLNNLDKDNNNDYHDEILFLKVEIYANGGDKVEKNHEKAIEYFNKIESDNQYYSSACCIMAKMYFEGNDKIEKDYNKCIHYFELINNSDLNPTKWYNLGFIHYSGGYGVEKNNRKAIRCFSSIEKTDKNYMRACYYLGLIYFDGEHGVRLNYTQSLEYFVQIKPNDKHYLYACYYLGVIYQNGGNGINVKLEKASKYYETVVEACNKLATGNYDTLLYCRTVNRWARLVSQNKSNDKIQQDGKNILDHLKIAAGLQNISAIYNMASLYLNGFYNIKPNTEEAIKHFSQASSMGHKKSKEVLYGLENGFLNQLKVTNNVETTYYLGCIYYESNADASKEKYKQAMAYFAKAACKGHKGALEKLSMCYRLGHGVPQDMTKSNEYKTRAECA